MLKEKSKPVLDVALYPTYEGDYIYRVDSAMMTMERRHGSEFGGNMQRKPPSLCG